MSPSLLIKWVHVLAGVFWIGGATFAAMYLVAALRALGPAAGPVMKYVMGVRKFPVALHTAAGLNVLTGLALFDHVSGHFQHLPVISFSGWMLTLGSLFGVIAFVWGVTVPAPAAKRLGVVTESLTGPPTPEQAQEIGKLQARLHFGGRVGVVLLVLALTGMVLSHPI